MTVSTCKRTGEPKRACKCSSCIGRRNRAAGGRKASAWWNAMGAHPEKWKGRAAHEETRTAAWRAEVKSGQQVERLAEAWRAAERSAPLWQRARFPILLPSRGDRYLVVVRLSDVRPLFEPRPIGDYAGTHTLATQGRTAKVWHTAYDHAREQSDAATPKTDGRPFVFGVMPPGTSDGFAVIEYAYLTAFHDALLAEWAKG